MDTTRPETGPENEPTQDSAERSIIDEMNISNDEAAQDLEETE